MALRDLLRRGEWFPGLQPDLSLVAMVAFATELISRGVDYALGDAEDVTSSLSVVEKAFPLQVWGLLCIVAGAMFVTGMVLRRFGALIFGSIMAMAVYGALSMGLFLKMVERGWPWDGWRTPLMFLVVALVFALFALSAYLKRAAVRAQRHMRHGKASEVSEGVS